MKNQRPIEMPGAPAIVKLLPEDRFLHRIAGLHEFIRRRAYQLYEQAGFRHGHDVEDWFLAESELLMPIPVEVSQGESAITVKAKVAGYDARDLEIHVQPQRLFITGERLQEPESSKEKAGHSTHLLQRVFRAIELPEEINPDKVKATLNNGELQIDLEKVKAEQKIAEVNAAAA